MKRNSEVVQDDEGKRIVVIHNIQFKGRQNIDWDSVENYIRRYIGQFVEIMDTGDILCNLKRERKKGRGGFVCRRLQASCAV